MVHQLKKDFNYYDVLQLERKLRVVMMGAFGNLSAEQANETAAGYHHTYFHADDVDLATLMLFPSDEELQEASEYAFTEVAQLLKLSGIDAKAMLLIYKEPEPTVLRPANFPSSRPPYNFVEMLEFTSLPDSTDETIEELRLDTEKQLTIDPVAPPQRIDHQLLTLTIDNKLYTDVLVSERMHHQPKSTAKPVRQHGRLSAIMVARTYAPTGDKPHAGPSLPQQLMNRLTALVPDGEASTTSKAAGPAVDQSTSSDQTGSSTPSLDDFEQLLLLGHGGTCIVYLVRKISTVRLYALKQVRKDKADVSQEQRILRTIAELDNAPKSLLTLEASRSDAKYYYLLTEKTWVASSAGHTERAPWTPPLRSVPVQPRKTPLTTGVPYRQGEDRLPQFVYATPGFFSPPPGGRK
ncbi:hypothetical protein R3P38DRAFT_3620539 [Favolaschia claudopus]|uniref:Protein kinase domain-containing protein n=1 Tax=Favolaschia claudopus TaxID=2862362 RepID=A0AAW0DC59_9AGAR